MPINTDALDLSQPLARQDIPAGEAAPLNPVISKDRLKQMGDLFRQAKAQDGAAPVATPAPADKLVAEPSLTSIPRTHGQPIQDKNAPGNKTAETPGAKEPAAEEEITAASLDPAALLSPRSRDAFQKLMNARDSYKDRMTKAEQMAAERETRLKALEEELPKLKNALPLDLEAVRIAAAKAEALTEENKKLLAKVESIDFERSDRFQNWWKEETGKNIKLAQRLVPAEHREAIAKIMMEASSQERSVALAKILEVTDEASKAIIGGAMKDVELAKIKREEALAENSGSLQKLREQERLERSQMEKAAATRREQITQAALARAGQFQAFKPIDGDAEHNAAIAIRKDFIRAAVAGQLDEDVAIALPGLAFEAVHLRDKVVPGLKAEIEKRDALIKQLQMASPAPQGGGNGGNGKASEVKPGASGKFLEAYRKAQQG